MGRARISPRLALPARAAHRPSSKGLPHVPRVSPATSPSPKKAPLVIGQPASAHLEALGAGLLVVSPDAAPGYPPRPLSNAGLSASREADGLCLSVMGPEGRARAWLPWDDITSIRLSYRTSNAWWRIPAAWAQLVAAFVWWPHTIPGEDDDPRDTARPAQVKVRIKTALGGYGTEINLHEGGRLARRRVAAWQRAVRSRAKAAQES